MSSHYFTASIWLALACGTIGFGVKAGLESSARVRQAERREALLGRMREAFLAVESGRVAEGVKILTDLAAEYPDNDAVALNRALALTADGRLDEADAILARILVRRPEDWDAVAERATIALRKRELDRALKLLEKIPVGGGQLKRRVHEHPAWADLAADPRSLAFLKKHGFTDRSDTSLRRIEELKAQQAATATASADAGVAPPTLQ